MHVDITAVDPSIPRETLDILHGGADMLERVKRFDRMRESAFMQDGA